VKSILRTLVFACLLSSCVVEAPKYTGIEEVLTLKTGMTKEEVSKTLGIPPYDLKTVTDTQSTYIYKYRTTDRRTVPLFMNKTNGMKSKGKWVDLFITYNKDGKVAEIRSCSDCEETKITEKKIDYNAIIALLAATVPAVLVYLGLQSNN
jgi:outer membrane protein assembly factor BamE (lipoprotein component of BamABCDE complex)